MSDVPLGQLAHPDAERDAVHPRLPKVGVCVCGHPNNMHYGGTREPHCCMKVVTRHPDPDKVIRCTCREFRPDTFQAKH